MSFLTTIPIQNTVDVKYTKLGPLISDSVGLMLSVAAILTFVYLVYGGISWIIGGGDKAKLEDAKNRITHAIIGLGITATAWAIFLLFDNFLGIGIAK
jgi:hypothetical protein